jgi:hypothetical protein
MARHRCVMRRPHAHKHTCGYGTGVAASARAIRTSQPDRHGPTTAMLFAEGWGFTCSECEHKVHADGCEACAEERYTEEHGESPMREPVVLDDAVFCDAACLRKWQAYRTARDRRKQLAAHRAIERWPSITITDVDGNVYVGGELGAVVTFTFDGNREGAWADGKPDVQNGERPVFRFHNEADAERWRVLSVGIDEFNMRRGTE